MSGLELFLAELGDPVLILGLLAVAVLFAAGHAFPIVLEALEARRRRRAVRQVLGPPGSRAAFVGEYEALCRKHRLYVTGGCGGCGGAFIWDAGRETRWPRPTASEAGADIAAHIQELRNVVDVHVPDWGADAGAQDLEDGRHRPRPLEVLLIVLLIAVIASTPAILNFLEGVRTW